MDKELKEEIKDGLEEIRVAVEVAVTDKYYDVIISSDYDISMRAQVVSVIARALADVQTVAEYPTNWRRFIKRKNCPEYMKKITKLEVQTYYPKLPVDPINWTTFRERNG